MHSGSHHPSSLSKALQQMGGISARILEDLHDHTAGSDSDSSMGKSRSPNQHFLPRDMPHCYEARKLPWLIAPYPYQLHPADIPKDCLLLFLPGQYLVLPVKFFPILRTRAGQQPQFLSSHKLQWKTLSSYFSVLSVSIPDTSLLDFLVDLLVNHHVPRTQ